MFKLLLVFIGGGLGSVIRFLVATFVNNRFVSDLPLATLLSNILSCIILGIASYLISEKQAFNQEVKLFLIIGLCGGLSTFSTFSLETLNLLKNQNYGYALANVLMSLFVCIGVLYFLVKKNIF